MYFAINGVLLNGDSLPEPAFGGAAYSLEDIDSSATGRNQYGNMIRERVAIKAKWQLTFPPMTQENVSKILNAVSPVSFDFTYPDPLSADGTSTVKCYAGPKQMPVYSTNYNGVVLWSTLSFSIIEM